MKYRYLYCVAMIWVESMLCSAPAVAPAIYRDPDAKPTPHKAQVDFIAVADPKYYSPASAGAVAVFGCGKDLARAEVPAGLSVIDSISAAGGLSRLSSRTVISIVTDDRTRMVQFSGLDIESPDGIAFYSRVLLRSGDILLVSERYIF